jgi:hypothetical protein
MTNPNNDVDVNTLIKIYNQKISTLTNQNILLEAKLNTLMQDDLDEKNDLLAKNRELQEKYDNLLSEIEEDGDSNK